MSQSIFWKNIHTLFHVILKMILSGNCNANIYFRWEITFTFGKLVTYKWQSRFWFRPPSSHHNFNHYAIILTKDLQECLFFIFSCFICGPADIRTPITINYVPDSEFCIASFQYVFFIFFNELAIPKEENRGWSSWIWLHNSERDCIQFLITHY